ncbi:MAG TPA: DUF3348 domain-containing protein [Rhodocyclaceae bacterium]|nr:DUF3348 domain-containing protein [Rhodocyclaceae bacterium]
MKQAPARSTFNSSKLIRSLSALQVAEVAESKQPIAERLGQWLGFNDALALFPILHPGSAAATDAPAVAAAGDSASLRDELTRVRAVLTRAITHTDWTELAAQARIESRPAIADGVAQVTADFFPYRRHCLALQRTMAMSIEALRGKARDALTGLSPQLKQLAALDAGLEQALALRERDLLGGVPTLLEKRFEQLREAHLQARSDRQTPDDPAQWILPGGWLSALHADLQGVLLAELELRLQPVTGLVEAHCNYCNEVTKSQ